MKTTTGLTAHLYVSKDEIQNIRNGGSTMIGSKHKTATADIHISVAVDACDFMDNEVRVNVSAIAATFESMGTKLAEAMAQGLQKAMSEME